MGWSTQRSAAAIIDDLRAARFALARAERDLREEARSGYGQRGYTLSAAAHARSRISELERELEEIT